MQAPLPCHSHHCCTREPCRTPPVVASSNRCPRTPWSDPRWTADDCSYAFPPLPFCKLWRVRIMRHHAWITNKIFGAISGAAAATPRSAALLSLFQASQTSSMPNFLSKVKSPDASSVTVDRPALILLPDAGLGERCWPSSATVCTKVA